MVILYERSFTIYTINKFAIVISLQFLYIEIYIDSIPLTKMVVMCCYTFWIYVVTCQAIKSNSNSYQLTII